MKEILNTERVQMDDNALEILIESAGNDIRQLINMLQLYTSTQKSTSFLQMKEHLNAISKDKTTMMNPFEAVTKLLNSRESHDLSIAKKMNLFFIDYDLIPLLVHENYLAPYGQNKELRDIQDAADSADYISLGDCANKTLRSENEWTLLSDIGLCSAVAPTTISARFPIFARFPAWFGKNSSTKKTKRLINEVTCAMSGKVNAPQDSIMNDIVPFLFSQTVKMLTEDRVEDAVGFLNEYKITIELFKENMAELCERTRQKYSFDKIETKTKAAFTRTYHKLHPDIIVKKKKKDVGSDDYKDKLDPDRESMEERSEEDKEEVEEEVVVLKSTETKGSKKNQKGTKQTKPKKERAKKEKARTKPKKTTKNPRRKQSKSDSLDNFIVDEIGRAHV
jgi:replication factor C subunit 1